MSQPRFNGKTVLDIAEFLSKVSAYFEFTRPGKFDLQNSQNSIINISLDSRQITQNDLFFAVQGETRHGIDFLANVLDKLPGLVICDRELTEQENTLLHESDSTCEVWIVEDISQFIGEFASWFYNYPSQNIKVVGITGTNGKTSTAFYTGQLLKSFGKKVALIGTLGNGPIDAIQQSTNTTPESVTVHRLLHEFYQQGIEWVIMEVSSHGLCLGRIQGVSFQTVALTQVTRDHIDFHGSEEAYQQAKAKLFSDYKTQNQVLNMDDSLGEQLCVDAKANHETGVWCYNANAQNLDRSANLTCLESHLNPEGMVFDAQLKEQAPVKGVQLPLMGLFNLENVFCACSILLVNDFNAKQLFNHLSTLTSVAGRMQILAKSTESTKSPTIILDFAHTPDALQQILMAIKAHLKDSAGKLTVVFGCGGNRDQGKRPLMGKIAENLADKVMLTSDNPRDEEPQQILLDIVNGLSQPQKAAKELDRQQAILSVLNSVTADDIVVIAGKGHENYQEIKGQKISYSDANVVNGWLNTLQRKTGKEPKTL